jgi:hypothetical protein
METVTTANGVQYFKSRLYSTTALTPQTTQFGGGKSGIAMALGLIASIAIPFVAPMIAGALFGAGTALATSSLVVGGIGATLGAAAGAGTAAIRGGNIGQGALFGGLVGGLGAGLNAGGGLFGATTAGADAAAAAGTAAVAPVVDATGTAVVAAAPTAGVAGAVAPTAAAAAAPAAAPGILSGLDTGKLTQSFLLAAPGLVSATMGGQSDAAKKDMERQYAAFSEAEAKAQVDKQKIFDEMLGNARNIDPQFAQQQATTDVFRSIGQQQRERVAGINAAGGASEDIYNAANTRRVNVEGTAAAIGAGNRAFIGAQGARDIALRNASAAAPRPSTAGLQYSMQMANMGAAADRQQAQGLGQMLGAATYPFLNPTYQQYARPTPTRTV